MKSEIVAVVLIMIATLSGADDRRVVTLDDALTAKSTGSLSVSPDGQLIAIEAEGGILLLSTQPPHSVLRRLEGNHPKWAPDGRTLAFYAMSNGNRQIQTWNRTQDVVVTVTNFPNGISPNPFNFMGDAADFSWAPDSTRIAFCSRVMSGYEDIGNEERPRIRVLTPSVSELKTMEGVFRTNFWDNFAPDSPDLDPKRMRAVEKKPDLGLNRLFIIDVGTKEIRQLTQSDQHFFPSWSPDGRMIACIVELGMSVEFFGAELSTELALFDARSGAEQRFVTSFRVNGPPSWSGDGSWLTMLGQDRLIGYHRVQLFSVSQRRSFTVRGPQNMAADHVRWTSDGHSLLVLAADRFIDSLWVVDPRSSDAHEVNTNGLNVARIDQDSRGNIYFTASSSTFTGRVFENSTTASRAVHEIYEPNPQFSRLLFGLQKRITWKNSAGEEVDGIVIFPPGYQPGHCYPLLIDLYPTPARDGLRLSAGALGQVEAANGYVVFLPALRAPNAAASFSRDQIYNEKARGAKGIAITVDDFASGVHYLEREGIADPRRIGLFGHSNGGYLVNMLITETTLARCAVVWSGASDLTYEQYFIPAWVHEIANGNLYDSFEDLLRLSPLFRMDRVDIPLLMVVGDHDWNTWLPEMLMQFNALKQLGKDVILVRYSDEGHNISHPDDIRDFAGRVQEFFDLHIGRKAAPFE